MVNYLIFKYLRSNIFFLNCCLVDIFLLFIIFLCVKTIHISNYQYSINDDILFLEVGFIYNNVIVSKSFNLALEIISIYKSLIIKKEFVLSKQLLRSGTSVGANIKEAIKGYSKNDFLYKMSIALKEANETEYWLELLIQSETLSDNTIQVSLIHCKEICKILNSIVSTARKSEH